MSSHLEQVDSSVQSTRLPGLGLQDIDATEHTKSARTHLDEDMTPATLSPILHSHNYVSRLPVELLCAIFIASTLQWHMEWLSEERPRSVLPPSVVVSHVCSFWRRVALNYSSLWSFLCLRSVLTMETFLARSKSSHLHIFYDSLNGRDSCEALLNALQHMNRIRELDLRCWGIEPGEIAIPEKLTAPAPVLYSLHLDTHQIPTNLFSGVVPSLHQVYLAKITEDLSSPILSTQLTHLTMVGGYHMDLEPFFQVLKQMPKLQQLSWQCDWRMRPTQSTDEVELPCLEELTLRDYHSTVAMFLNRLKFPSNAVVKLEPHGLQGGHGGYIHTFIRERFNSNPGIPQDDMTLRTLSIGRYWSIGCHRRTTGIYCSSNVEANDMDPHPLDSSRHLYILFDKASKSIHDLAFTRPMSKFCVSLPVSHLRKLTMRGDFCRKDCCPWPISNPPRLHTIIIDTGYPSNMVRALLPHEVTTPIFAPALTEIWLRGVEFAWECFRPDDQRRECGGSASCSSCSQPRYSSVMRFYDMLAERAVRGSRLRRLRLEKCPGIGEADVTKLREVVYEVEVDYDMSMEI